MSTMSKSFPLRSAVTARREDRSHSTTNLGFKYYLSFVLMLTALLPAAGAASNAIATGFYVYGAPPGSSFIWRMAPNYTTITTPITGYSTFIPVNVSSATNTTYHGAIPWQYQGAGTTLSLNGITYTMLTGTAGTCSTQIVNTNGLNDFCSFYVYLNASLWNTNEAAELTASNASLASAKLIVKSITNTTRTIPYNGTLAAGNVLKYAADANGSITFYNNTTTKAQAACIYINLVSVPFCANATTPQRISVPVFNGHYGISGGITYPLTVAFKAKLFGSQTAPFNYSVIDLTSNTALIPLTNTANTNNLNVVQSFSVPIADSVEITAGSRGSLNYSSQYIDPVTVPTNIVAYLPITENNIQTSALSANTQIMLTINSLAYQQYETSNLLNGEFFYANGTIIPSWLEGNLLNEQQTANIFTSENTVYWLLISNAQNFLPASSTNTLYFGWAGNVITASNTLFSNTITGEAPLLSGTYAQYDTGSSVFNYYQAWGGLSTLPTGWSSTYLGSATGTQTFAATSAFFKTVASSSFSVYNALPASVQNDIFDKYATMSNANWYEGFGVSNNIINLVGGGSLGFQSTAGFIGTTNAGGSPNEIYVSNNAARQIEITAAAGVNALTNPQVYSVFVDSANVLHTYLNYSNSLITSTPTLVGYNAVYMTIQSGTGGVILPNGDYVYWLRGRTPPPNNIQPTATFGAVTIPGATCASSITNPSNAIADVGQYESFTATESDCASTFTYNMLAVNSITPATITHNSLITGASATSETFSFQTTSADTSNSPEKANVVVTDSGTNTVTSGYSSNFVINTALTAPSISPSAANTIDAGETLTFSTSLSGGTAPYTYNWLVVNSITGSLMANALYASVASTSNSFGWAVPSADAGNTVQGNVIATDSATTPVTLNSVKSGTITIDSGLAAGAITPSAPTIDSGQTITLTANPSGGSGTYAYSWYTNSGGSPACTAANVITGATSSTYLASPTTSNDYTYQVIDTGLLPETKCSASDAVAVNAAQAVPTLASSPVLPNSLATGDLITFTATRSGGTSPFSFNYLITNTITGTLVANMLFTGVTTATNAFSWAIPNADAGNTVQANVLVTDSAYSPSTVNSVKSGTLTITQGLNLVSWTDSNALIDVNQYQKLTATLQYGTAPYTYNILIYNPSGTLTYNSLDAGDSSTSNAFVFQQGTPTGQWMANVIITDSAGLPQTVKSSITYGVNAVLAAGAITPAAPAIDSGQSITLTANPSGGTTAYAYKWYTIAGSTAPTCTAGNVISSATSSTYAASPATTNSYAYQVTDSATTNAVLCSAGDTVTVNAALGTPALTPSATQTIDSGQSVSFTSSTSGGTTPLSYQWRSGASTCTSGSTAIAGQTSSSYAPAPSATIYYCLTATDSAYSPSSTTSSATKVTVNAALAAGAVTPSSPQIDAGQSITLTANPTGGTTPYSYLWYSGTSATCASDTSTGITTSTYSPSPSSTTYYCYQVTDSASTPVAIKSATDLVTVNAALSIPTLASSPVLPSTQSAGNTITFTASWSGGTSAYTANYLITNTVTGALAANMLHTGLAGTSDTWAWAIPSSAPGNTFQANVIVTDSATTPVTVNSVKTSTLTVVDPPPYSISASQYQILGTQQTLSVLGTGTDYSTLNVILPGSATPIQLKGSTQGELQYTFGSPYNGFIGVYQFNAFDQNTLASNTLSITMYADPYYRNATNTIEYPSNAYPFTSNTYYPYKLWGNQTANDIVGTNNVYFNVNYSTTVGGIYLNPTIINNVYVYTEYNANTVLTGNIIAYDIKIDGGTTLSTQGYSLIAYNALINNGIISTNALSNGGGASAGGSILTSYAGSGGGGGGANTVQGGGSEINGFNGGNTIAPAGLGGAGAGSAPSNGVAGAAPASPLLTNANILLWYSNGIQNYLGAAGGGGGANAGSPGSGSSGAFGLYVQANNIYAGNIVAAGVGGGAGGLCSGGGGGGGGGLVILAYNSIFSTGTYNTIGGAGGGGGSASSGACPAAGHGGAGGAGNVLTQRWTSQPITESNPKQTYLITTNALSYSFILPPNSPSAQYYYQTKETQLANSIILNATVITNMTDINGVFTFNALCTPLIQYSPNCAVFPSGANVFTAKPSSWEIKSDVLLNQYANVSNLDEWSNANVTFMPKVELNYPFTSFIANVSNNPGITQLTQDQWKVYAQNSIPSAPYTRELQAVNTLDQQFLSALNTNDTNAFQALFNNYILPDNTTTVTNTIGYNVYIPLSNYLNPQIYIYNISLLSKSLNHYAEINNFCPVTLAAAAHTTYKAYLANLNASLYTFNIYQGSGIGAVNYTMVVQTGASSSSAIQVQSYKIAAVPFALPLQNGQQYRFLFYDKNCTLAYTSPLSIWPQTITLNLPSNQSIGPFSYPKVSAACSTYQNSTREWVVCTGSDPTSLTTGWQINITRPSPLRTIAVQNFSFSSASFSLNWTVPSNTVQYTLPIVAIVYNGSSSHLAVLTYVVNNSVPPVSLPLSIGLMMLFLLLVLVFSAAREIEVAVIVALVGVFFGGLAGLNAITLSSFILIFIVGIYVVYLMRKER